MKKIEKKIKELYNNDKALFAGKINVDPKNLSKKIKTVKNKIQFVNEFLNYLNLEAIITEKPQQ